MLLDSILRSPTPVLLDGAMGTCLRSALPDYTGLPDLLSLRSPEAVESVHRAYAEAGSRILYTNTFGATDAKLAGSGATLEDVIRAAVRAAKRAALDRAAVALDLGPTGRMMPPIGDATFDEIYESFRRRAVIGEEAGADLIVLETMGDLSEVRTAMLAVKENTRLPLFVTMTFEANGCTFAGCTPESFASLAEALGADAIGVNCSLGPVQLEPIVRRIAGVTSLPLIVKANAGLPDETGRYSITEQEFADAMRIYPSMGVRYLGGCCGTSPAFLRTLSGTVSDLRVAVRTVPYRPCAVTAQRVVPLDGITVVGERLNPTGKKKLSAALASGDDAYLISVAKEEDRAGAALLDVNVGIPGGNWPDLMRHAVRTVSAVTDLPLQIDASDPETLEAGLRAFNGRAVINSVNGTEDSLQNVIPLAKKYGAALIGLTLDENGIPADAQGRIAIAKKIRDRAVAFGIREADLFIDCLTFAVSADARAASVTLDAIRGVRSLGLKTALGVSNISFGLPERDLVSSAFLSMALEAGLNLIIMNPCSARMTETVAASRALLGADESCLSYIAFASANGSASAPAAVKRSPSEAFADAILDGDASASCIAAQDLISGGCPVESLVESHLIPALDSVGRKFETGEYFLPQLVRSAEAASAVFEVLRKEGSGNAGANGPAILLATVQGDIHDIGKNIVKMVLTNYGYQVVDLGKDVSPEMIVETAVAQGIRLIGLSALMTTTLPAMERTIAALRASGHDCRVMVGGAVLTPEYAQKIGADYYAKDATQSAEIAKTVFGGNGR